MAASSGANKVRVDINITAVTTAGMIVPNVPGAKFSRWFSGKGPTPGRKNVPRTHQASK